MVPNAYRFPAYTSAVTVAKLRGKLRIRIAQIRANKNSAVTWFGPQSCRDRDVEQWFAGMNVIGPLTKYQAMSLDQWMVVPPADRKVL